LAQGALSAWTSELQKLERDGSNPVAFFIGVICPSGSFATPLSSPSCKNIPLAPSGKSVALTRAVSSHRGALANVINAAGDAVDADARFDEQR
jgi:hypothetical protein